MQKDPADLKLLAPILLPFLFYPIGAWVILRLFPSQARAPLFAAFNVVAAFATCLVTFVAPLGFDPDLVRMFAGIIAPIFGIYVLLTLVNYGLLRRSDHGGLSTLAAFLAPIFALIVIKYVPTVDRAMAPYLQQLGQTHVSAIFLGISYVSFRLTHVVQEVQNGQARMPSVWDYLSFAFFVPTLAVGPINPYSRFESYLQPPDRTKTPIGRCAGRIVVGLWKYLLLSNVVGQFTYAGLLLDGHPHRWIDLPIAIVAYAVFLYCNFSGLCDVVIGVSGLLGIEVIENFDRPFAARNFQEFWTRWHISLSQWLRDLMFTPLVKSLGRAWGPKRLNHAIAVAILAVFLTIGVWHGAGLNFVLFGLSQGLGVATVHYSTAYMRKRLGKAGFAAYRENPVYYRLGQIATFAYFALTLILFANSMDDLAEIARAISSS